MNKARRKQISELYSQVEELLSKLDAIRDDEQEAFDNMPEGIQQGERGELAQSAINNLEDAYNSLESVKENLENAQE